MSRWEFMRQLEELLSDISPSEREEALQYYNDYFNDAGKENEQDVMKALGNPAQVAKTVKEGLSENGGAGFFTENGFKDNNAPAQNEIMKKSSDSNTNNADNKASNSDTQPEKKEGLPTWAIVLIVIACICGSPLIFGFVASVFGIVISIFASIFALVFGLGAASIGLFIATIALFITGFGILLAHPLAAMLVIGTACLCLGLGILFMLLTVLLVGKAIPAICQALGYIFSKLFGKKGGTKA